jgi:hypothetical protein
MKSAPTTGKPQPVLALAGNQWDAAGLSGDEGPSGRVERYWGLVITPHAIRAGAALEAPLATA